VQTDVVVAAALFMYWGLGALGTLFFFNLALYPFRAALSLNFSCLGDSAADTTEMMLHTARKARRKRRSVLDILRQSLKQQV